MVYEGQNFELRCNAAGIPRPIITWQRVRGSLPSSARMLPNGLISFKGARTSDSGLYQCVAKNPVGTSVQTLTLYVRSRPSYVWFSVFSFFHFLSIRNHSEPSQFIHLKFSHLLHSIRTEGYTYLFPSGLPCGVFPCFCKRHCTAF